jgi:signal transduction histidine kinase
VTGRSTAIAIAARLRHPQTTVRWRLTLLYGALFLVSGAILLTVTYVLVEHAAVSRPPGGPFLKGTALQRRTPAPGAVRPDKFNQAFAQLPSRITSVLQSPDGQVAIRIVGAKQRLADLHQLIVESSIALAIMAIISAALGWLVAGRVLRPLRTMTTAAQQISEVNLHERLALEGPRDELRQLADTIDRLLARLEAAFNAQRRFVANASHELRTPLTAARALLEMVLTDPRATMETFRTTCRQVLEESEEQEQLIDALLALAQGERGIDRRASVDLSVLVAGALHSYSANAAERGLALQTSLAPARLSGDGRLVERLVANLLENALRHNVPDGRIAVSVTSLHGEAELVVTNTGAPVPADQIERLLQPFQRLGADRLRQREGFGLGLSIVAAIASAHDATLHVQPGADGGLEVRVHFPRPVEAEPQPAKPGSGERRAGQERPQSPRLAAHAQGAVGADLEPGSDDDVDGPILTGGDPADRPLDIAGDVERAPQQR